MVKTSSESTSEESRLLRQLTELDREAHEIGEPAIAAAAKQLALQVARYSKLLTGERVRPSLFATGSGGVVLTWQNRQRRKRLSVEISGEATQFLVTPLALAHSLEGQAQQTLHPSRPQALETWFAWLMSESEELDTSGEQDRDRG